MRDVREWSKGLLRLAKRRREPVVVQTLRSATAATIAYVIALRLSPEPAPLTAPLTALLVVQVTFYATLTNGIRRVNSVVAGVLVAIAFSVLVGLTWWSLALLIVAALAVGHLVRVDEYVAEVAISAMLVLGVTTVGFTAWARIVET
ncbi:aromatic acid exporter family protein, partial [Streptomyces capoamus]